MKRPRLGDWWGREVKGNSPLRRLFLVDKQLLQGGNKKCYKSKKKNGVFDSRKGGRYWHVCEFV